MKKTMSFVLMVFLLLTTLLSGCGGGSTPPASPSPTPSPTPTPTPTPAVLFQDNFNYTATSPADWTPSNGWTGGNWTIITGGFSGNGIQYNHATMAGYLTNDYTGSNYKISAKVKPGTIAGDSLIGISGRYVDDTHYYELALRTNSATGPTEIGIYKMWKIGDDGQFGAITSHSFLTGALTPDTFYDLTFTITGSSPVTLTGKVSDGTHTAEVTVTDDGSSWGTSYSSGKVGLMVIPYTPSYPTFDNFLVMTP